MRRWLKRILLSLAVLLVVVLIAVQVVFWTDYPRRIVLSLVQQNLGLRVQASGLSTGWTGRTVLRDVKLSLPLADESFFDVPRLEVNHSSVLRLVLTQSFAVNGIELTRPNVVLRRDAGGKWNLQEVAELVQRATAGTPEPGTKKKPPKLPRLRLIDGTINVIERSNQRAVIAPLNVTGYPDGPLVYRYDAEVPRRIKAVGEVAPGEQFKHELRFFAEPPREWLTPWVLDPPFPIRANGRWTGIVNDGSVGGRLIIEEAQVANFGATGRVAAQVGGPRSVFSPQAVVVTTGIKALPKVEIASGTVSVDGSVISAQQLRVGAFGGLAQVDGTGDLDAKTAEIHGVWQDLALGSQVAHGGNLRLNIRSPFPGRPHVEGTIVTRGRAPQGNWDGHLTINGGGRNWNDMDWTVGVPRLAWIAKLPLTIENLTARIATREHVITLTELRWPAAEVLAANGRYNVADKTWLLRARGRGTFPVNVEPTADRPAAVEPRPFDFNLDTYGNTERVHLNELFVHVRELDVRATGDLVFGVPEPVSLSLYATHLPPDASADAQSPVRGRFRSEGHVRGTLDPLRLAFTGTVRGTDLVVLDRPFGDIRGVMDGIVNESSGAFVMRDVALLGGKWSVGGVWPYNEPDKMSDHDSLRVSVDVEQLSLKEIGELLRTPGVGGTVNGGWKIDITKPRRDLIAARGSFTATDLVAKDFQARQVTGEMNLRNGLLRIDPVQFRHGESGQATATVEARMANLQQPTVALNVQAWPVALSKISSAAVWAEANLVVDARAQSATGPVKARALFATTQQAIGEATLAGAMQGRTLALDNIASSAAGGAANGRATINLDDPNASSAILSWSGIDGQRLSALLPSLEGLSGTFNGALTVDPASDPRALEPLRLRVQLNPENGRLRSASIGRAKLSAFMNLAPNFQPQRVVLDELPSENREAAAREAEMEQNKVPPGERPLGWNDLRIADGRVRIWARRGRHAGGDEQTHLIVNFARLDLDQLVHAVKPDEEPMPARLSGRLVVHGNPGNLNELLGDGRVEISESDLVNIRALRLIYDAASLGTSPKSPNGHGSLDFSLQRSALSLDRVYYFNRGVEAWSSNLTIRDIWDAPNSPIDGYVVGSARPLSALKLPLLADADQILSVLQSGLTTVKVSGMLGDTEVTLGTFADVGGGLKQFLTGQVQETRGR